MRRHYRAAVSALAFALCVSAGALAHSFLPPSLAFQVTARRLTPSSAEVDFRIAPGYMINRQRITIRAATRGVGVHFHLPPGALYKIPYIAPESVYQGTVTVHLALQGPAARGALKLLIGLQGCARAGICYPPEDRTISVASAR